MKMCAARHSEPASWTLERVRRYGVASLLTGGQPDFLFILCAQSVPRPALSGTKDFHREKLRDAERNDRRAGPGGL